MTNSPTGRVNEIDLLRFFAALSVVFFHYSFRGYAADNMSVMPYPMLASVSKYGYLGVKLFFMISGFVILMTAASGNLRNFIISRVVRLYPTFWACCTLTFAVIITFGAPRYYASINQYLVNMTMLSGVFDVSSIDGAYWSIFIELQFYTLVTIILIIGKIHQAETLLLLWLVASVALVIHPIWKLNQLLLTSNSANFIAGATYYLIWSKGPSLIRVAIVTVSWWLAVFQSTSIYELGWFENYYNTSMSSYITAAIITAFFAIMMLISLRRTGLFARIRWTLLGALTYPLYLIHQTIGYIVFNASYPAYNTHLIFWGTLVAALVSAYAVHIFIEMRYSPMIKVALNKLIDSMRSHRA